MLTEALEHQPNVPRALWSPRRHWSLGLSHWTRVGRKHRCRSGRKTIVISYVESCVDAVFSEGI